MSKAPDFRAKAVTCTDRARQSTSLKDIRHFRRIQLGFVTLAENEDWLAGDVPPLSDETHPSTQSGT